MTESISIFLISLGCGVIAAIVLLLEHVLMWDAKWRLTRPAAYGVGVGTLAGGVLLTSLLIGDLSPFLVGLGVTIPGGLLIIVAYYIRGRTAPQTAPSRKRDALSAMIFDEVETSHGAARKSDARSN